MLVNATNMLQAAQRGQYALGAFNTNNLEWAASILDAAEELQSPVIDPVHERRCQVAGQLQGRRRSGA